MPNKYPSTQGTLTTLAYRAQNSTQGKRSTQAGFALFFSTLPERKNGSTQVPRACPGQTFVGMGTLNSLNNNTLNRSTQVPMAIVPTNYCQKSKIWLSSPRARAGLLGLMGLMERGGKEQ